MLSIKYQLFYIIIKWNSSPYKTFKLPYTANGAIGVYSNIIKLSKYAKFLKYITLLFLFFRSNSFSFTLIFLYNLILSRLIKSLKRNAYYIIELIIYSIVIRYNGTQLLHNPIVLKYKKKSILLLISAIRGYRIKAKESIYKLFLAINKIAVNYKEKVII